MGKEDDFLLDDYDDEKTIEFIKNYLPQDLKEKFSDDLLQYFIDLLDEYYVDNSVFDNVTPDDEGYIELDLDPIVAYIVEEAARDGMGEFDPEDILFVVQGELEYGESLGN